MKNPNPYPKRELAFLLCLILLPGLLFFSGCAKNYQPPSGCDENQSAILKITKGNPTGLDRALLVVNTAALEKGVYSAEQAEDFLLMVQERIGAGINYIDLLSYLQRSVENVNKMAGLAVIILGPDVPAVAKLGGEQIISACDQELIERHLNKQQLVTNLYK